MNRPLSFHNPEAYPVSSSSVLVLILVSSTYRFTPL